MDRRSRAHAARTTASLQRLQPSKRIRPVSDTRHVRRFCDRNAALGERLRPTEIARHDRRCGSELTRATGDKTNNNNYKHKRAKLK
ncbi:hypothetical protein EVAR_60914_1 [Eumeta japonica]|uniref:Uncharacterized protein n=1 Tax=Eumeta variegata TaxID=151549 RepID=A0A4C1ZHP3_EUMVA|nr:hypothetical protein EVAR_60914_1 [Eumeta japonica]